MGRRTSPAKARRLYLGDSTSAPIDDNRLSEQAKDLLLAEWKQTIRYQSPLKRRSWLERVGIIAFGSAESWKLRQELETARETIRDLAPTQAWTESWETREEVIPIREAVVAQLQSDAVTAAIKRIDRRQFKRMKSIELLDLQRAACVDVLSRLATIARANCTGMLLAEVVSLTPGCGVAKKRLMPDSSAELENRLDALDYPEFDSRYYDSPFYGHALTVHDLMGPDPKETFKHKAPPRERRKRLKMRGEDPFACVWSVDGHS